MFWESDQFTHWDSDSWLSLFFNFIFGIIFVVLANLLLQLMNSRFAFRYLLTFFPLVFPYLDLNSIYDVYYFLPEWLIVIASILSLSARYNKNSSSLYFYAGLLFGFSMVFSVEYFLYFMLVLIGLNINSYSFFRHIIILMFGIIVGLYVYFGIAYLNEQPISIAPLKLHPIQEFDIYKYPYFWMFPIPFLGVLSMALTRTKIDFRFYWWLSISMTTVSAIAILSNSLFPIYWVSIFVAVTFAIITDSARTRSMTYLALSTCVFLIQVYTHLH